MVIGPNYTTNRIHFDVYGNSPVVSHYLKVAGAKNNLKKLTIHRSQVVKDRDEDETLPRIANLVSDSLKKSRARDRAFDEVEKHVRAERKKAQVDFKVCTFPIPSGGNGTTAQDAQGHMAEARVCQGDEYAGLGKPGYAKKAAKSSKNHFYGRVMKEGRKEIS